MILLVEKATCMCLGNIREAFSLPREFGANPNCAHYLCYW